LRFVAAPVQALARRAKVARSTFISPTLVETMIRSCSFTAPRRLPFVSTVVAALLAGCASVPSAPGVASASATTAPPPATGAGAAPARAASASGPAASASAPAAQAAARPAPAPAPAPGTPPPFADVTKGAKSAEGYLTVWTRDEKTWLEIPPDRLDRPFFLGVSLASGLG
jgi:hypothetical protein